MACSILRLPIVIEKTGLSRSTIYRYLGDGNFPSPIKIGYRAVGWRANDIDLWLNEKQQKVEE